MNSQYGPLPMLVAQLVEQHAVNGAHDTLREGPERVICLFFTLRKWDLAHRLSLGL